MTNIDSLIEKKVKKLEDEKGLTRTILDAINVFQLSPRFEIRNVLLIVRAAAERQRDRIEREGSSAERDILATIFAYLEMAAKEKSFAMAWCFANQADAHLPLVVEEKELKGVIQRLHSWDTRVPSHLQVNLDPLPENFKYTNATRYELFSRQKSRASILAFFKFKSFIKK